MPQHTTAGTFFTLAISLMIGHLHVFRDVFDDKRNTRRLRINVLKFLRQNYLLDIIFNFKFYQITNVCAKHDPGSFSLDFIWNSTTYHIDRYPIAQKLIYIPCNFQKSHSNFAEHF